MAALAQYFFQNNIFICPPTGYQEYANIVLYTPMLTLFVISLMIHPSFADLLKQKIRTNVFNMFNKKMRNTQNLPQCYGCRYPFWIMMIHNVIFAMTPSMVWIILCLLRKNIYVCSKVGPKMYNGTIPNQLQVNYHRAESMKLGFTLLQIFSAVLIISKLMKSFIAKTANVGELFSIL